ncbi:MAG: tetratricopeptide repeat protein [Caldilineaceae bacterium]|nr:tetratricopeptide repeat protein [Caldilineaceae bacterium]
MSNPRSAAVFAYPMPLTPLLGRDLEIRAVCRLLQQPDVRLITLTGPGGVGKTRLALQVAQTCQRAFADGAVVVSLVPIRDPALVLPTIAQALGIQDAGDLPPLDRLQSYLQEKELLLLLDNVEQVVAAAPALAQLLMTCPYLTLLVTSRAALHLSGEYTYPVAPLALPDLRQLPPLTDLAQIPSVALFVQRTHAAMPTFQLDETNAAAVAALCVHLDGLPLALELAAARSKWLPPHTILARLTATPGARLQLLRGGPLDVPARQQTLRETIAWSYHLLTPPEQLLFRRLAVFAGGFTLTALEAFTEACVGQADQAVSSRATDLLPFTVLDGLTQLLDKSLLIPMVTPSSQAALQPRYTLLETIREYALEQLTSSGELATSQQAHASYYLALAVAAEPYLAGPEQGRWLAQLETEHDNLRAALHWSTTAGMVEIALPLAGALWWFWYRRGYWHEGRQWLQQVLALPAPTATAMLPWRAKALNGAGILAYYQGDYSQATTLSGASVRLFRQLNDKHGLAGALHGLALVARSADHYAVAQAIYQESLALYREVGDHSQTAYTLFYFGVVFWFKGDYAAAEPPFLESLTMAQELHDPKMIAFAAFGLGYVALGRCDYVAARRYFEECFQANTRFGDQRALSRSSYGLGDTAMGEYDYPAAYTYYMQSLTLCQTLGDRYVAIWALEGVARVASAYGQWRCAVQLLSVGVALHKLLGISQAPFRQPTYTALLATLRTQLPEPEFTAAWEAGQGLSLTQAIQLAHVTSTVIAAAKSAPASPPSSSSPVARTLDKAPESLTRREAEVLRLVVTGMTDAEIAATLVVSPRTVNAHLRSIYSKLGVTSRHAATHYARTQGLVDPLA